MKSRLARAIKDMSQWCHENMHKPVEWQWTKLCEKVRGHYCYDGITGNRRAIHMFLNEVYSKWRFWLNRRNREKRMTWEKFYRLRKRYPLPYPKLVHVDSSWGRKE